MLNRRILRIKAFKVLYSYAENPSMTLKEALAQLEKSCQATRDLYLYMLSLVVPLTDEARSRAEAGRNKFNPTEEELHPNMKFVENAIAPLLASDPDFCKLVSKKKLSWDNNDALIRRLYENIRSRDYFKDYLASGPSSIKEDAALLVKIYEQELDGDEGLEEILEEMNIFWTDDLAYALTYCCRTFKSLGKGARWELPALYQSDLLRKDKPEMDSDRDFVVKLLTSAFNGYRRYYDMIAESVPKWDSDRLFAVDAALIACGLAEAENFPEIPSRVTVNEYVEISKYYSTPKSRSFVNGLLDKLIKTKLSITI